MSLFNNYINFAIMFNKNNYIGGGYITNHSIINDIITYLQENCIILKREFEKSDLLSKLLEKPVVKLNDITKISFINTCKQELDRIIDTIKKSEEYKKQSEYNVKYNEYIKQIEPIKKQIEEYNTVIEQLNNKITKIQKNIFPELLKGQPEPIMITDNLLCVDTINLKTIVNTEDTNYYVHLPEDIKQIKFNFNLYKFNLSQLNSPNSIIIIKIKNNDYLIFKHSYDVYIQIKVEKTTTRSIDAINDPSILDYIKNWNIIRTEYLQLKPPTEISYVNDQNIKPINAIVDYENYFYKLVVLPQNTFATRWITKVL